MARPNQHVTEWTLTHDLNVEKLADGRRNPISRNTKIAAHVGALTLLQHQTFAVHELEGCVADTEHKSTLFRCNVSVRIMCAKQRNGILIEMPMLLLLVLCRGQKSHCLTVIRDTHLCIIYSIKLFLVGSLLLIIFFQHNLIQGFGAVWRKKRSASH